MEESNNNKMNSANTIVSWLQGLLELARKYRFVEWCEVFLVVAVIGVMVTVFSNPAGVMDYFQKAVEEQHQEKMEYRQQNTVQVQREVDKLLYTLDADRVIVLENHNGNNSVAGVPFLKSTVTFESIQEGVYPIAPQYQQVQLSLIPFANYLYQKNYWCGPTESIKPYDASLSYRMLSNATIYFAAEVISGEDRAIGFLFVSWTSHTPPDPEVIREEMNRASVKLGVLLELKKRN